MLLVCTGAGWRTDAHDVRGLGGGCARSALLIDLLLPLVCGDGGWGMYRPHHPFTLNETDRTAPPLVLRAIGRLRLAVYCINHFPCDGNVRRCSSVAGDRQCLPVWGYGVAGGLVGGGTGVSKVWQRFPCLPSLFAHVLIHRALPLEEGSQRPLSSHMRLPAAVAYHPYPPLPTLPLW